MRQIVRPHWPRKSRDSAGHQSRQYSQDATERTTDPARRTPDAWHDESFGIPIVVVEETLRGWLAAIAKERLAQRQVAAYRELGSLFGFFATFQIAPFDRAGAERFDSLYAAKIRIATARFENCGHIIGQ